MLSSCPFWFYVDIQRDWKLGCHHLPYSQSLNSCILNANAATNSTFSSAPQYLCHFLRVYNPVLEPLITWPMGYGHVPAANGHWDEIYGPKCSDRTKHTKACICHTHMPHFPIWKNRWLWFSLISVLVCLGCYKKYQRLVA